MLRQLMLILPVLLVLTLTAFAQTTVRRSIHFSDSWKFYRGDATGGADQVSFPDNDWETVCLPHTVKLESAKTHGSYDYYHGYCWYRKTFTPNALWQGKKAFLEFEAGMQTTDVWVNGAKKTTFNGGYSPFTIDITGDIKYDQANVVAVRLNNNASATFPPGNAEPDFYYYGGLYRYVNLHITDPLHITDAVYANKVAGGGVFVTYPPVTTGSATVQVKTNVINENADARSCALRTALCKPDGQEVAGANASATMSIPAGRDTTFSQSLTVSSPRLWSPDAPNLYVIKSQVSDGARLTDEVRTTIGIRRIAFTRANGLQINGTRLKSKGVNRHQDYGCIGNAVPVSGHWRDALRMKEAGVNFVRLSHYIQHPSFLDACDYYGITVQACMPGWQYQGFSNATWVANSVRDLRTMIRYYRNHPCVVMWESIHNESAPPASFATQCQTAAHEEFPGDQMYTCGQEANNIMDIYQAAVQQSGRTYSTSKPQAISEYGHWEYGGFTGTSNQPRSAGEAGMLTLAGNQASAMSQDHALSWLAVDGVWVWNDYFGFSQYINSLCSGGVVDMFRIPKFGYYFYQSQRDPDLTVSRVNSGPMVFIANFWTAQSTRSVRVFSNCRQVSLYLNDTLVATRSPDVLANIDHPPFTFTISSFSAGTLRADGLIGGTVRAMHEVKTPLTAVRVRITIDTANMALVADGADLALVYGSIVDDNGTVIPGATNPVTFSVSGPGAIISGDGNPVTAVAGIAAAYVQTRLNSPGAITVTGAATGLASGSATVRSITPPRDTGTSVSPSPAPANAAKGSGTAFFRKGRSLHMVRGAFWAREESPPVTFSLYNQQGRIMRVWNLTPGPIMSVDLGCFAAGVYHGTVKIKDRVENVPVLITGH
jgi:beta-galactosidase